jgi:hypothetical protein
MAHDIFVKSSLFVIANASGVLFISSIIYVAFFRKDPFVERVHNLNFFYKNFGAIYGISQYLSLVAFEEKADRIRERGPNYTRAMVTKHGINRGRIGDIVTKINGPITLELDKYGDIFKTEMLTFTLDDCIPIREVN